MTTAANLTVNTSGHKLYVKSLDPWQPTTITDTVGGGELHLVVPEGCETYNNIFSLSGKLKLVKEGKGIYLAVKKNQTYSGGTEIKGGPLSQWGGRLGEPPLPFSRQDGISPERNESAKRMP